MGRKAKPNNLKVISGTDRPDREREEVSLDSLTECPDAPAWLDSHGVEEWNRVAPILVANGLLGAVDLTNLAHYCDAHANILRKKHAQQNVTASDRNCLLQWACKFYLTPASRVLGPKKDAGDDNPWAEHGKPPAA